MTNFFYAREGIDNLAIFVDVQNIYYTTKEAYNKKFDYKKFFDKANENRNLISATAYAIEPADKKQEQFQNILRNIGFTVKLKPFTQRIDGSAKGDWDVGIAIDVIEKTNFGYTVVLASGDGDFEILVRRVIEKFNAKVDVYGVPSLTANSLKTAATKFIPIENDLLINN